MSRYSSRALAERRELLAALLAEQGARLPERIPRRTHGGPVPASFAQRRLWFLEQLEPGTTAYTIAGGLPLPGPLHVDALQRALNEIVRRHEALRTTFTAPAGEPLQVVAPALELPLAVHTARDETSRRAIARAEADRPFDLERGPLLRAVLVTLPGDEHELLLTMHHIVSDGWSLEVLYRELRTLYAAFSAGEPSPLAELAIQYPDFALWQREHPGGEEQLERWCRRLEGAPTVLELPADHPRAAVTTHAGGAESLLLGGAESAALRELGAAEEATPYMLVVSAFAVLAHRMSGQDELLIGMPVAGRTRAETEPLIGFFVNTLALRVDASGRPSFRALLRRVRAAVLEALADQDVPFERLVEELAPGRDTRRTPLVQVMVNQLDASDERSPERWSAADGYGAKFDVTLYASDEAGRLRLLIVYARELFEAARMAEMVEQLATLLGAAAEAPDTGIERLPLTTQPLRLGPLSARWPGSVSERVARHEAERAAVAGDCTYGELDARASRLAGWLREQGLRRGGVVAVEADRAGALACALLGVWRAGGAFAILDAAQPELRRAQLRESARPAVVLKLRDGLPAGPPIAETAGPDDLAYLAFTSGTTGAPKLVAGRHGPLAHFLAWHAETFDLRPEDRFAMLSGLGHDPLLRDVFAPLWVGGTLCVPDDAPGWPARAGITVAHLVPSVARVLAADERAPDLRLICLGGDVATGCDVRRLREWAPGARVVSFYGTTETPQAAAWHPDPDETDDRPVALGTGIEGVELLVVRDDLEPAGVGELGEVVVRTPHLTDCESVELAGVRAFRTGDRGRYDAAGRVHFAGRADGQLKIRGVRIEPAEVEAALRTHPAVADAHVAGSDGELVGYVVGAEPADLRRHLAERLPAVMVPTRWARLNALPRNAGGKVDRAKLPIPAVAPTEGRPAISDLEQTIAGVWSEALGRPAVGADDDFFELGGHSLLATQVVARIRSELGIELALRELFERRTVAGLAAAIEANGHRVSAPPITALPRRLEAT